MGHVGLGTHYAVQVVLELGVLSATMPCLIQQQSGEEAENLLDS